MLSVAEGSVCGLPTSVQSTLKKLHTSGAGSTEGGLSEPGAQISHTWCGYWSEPGKSNHIWQSSYMRIIQTFSFVVLLFKFWYVCGENLN
jgi:hypothetical protein